VGYPRLAAIGKTPQPLQCTMTSRLPVIIQGGMGVGISGWRLARAVARAGQLGVVSGTALDVIVPRRLQDGDEGGHIRRALEAFPIPGVGGRIIERYYIAGGRAKGMGYKSKPLPSARPSRAAEELIVASNFVEVYLAKEGHNGLVGINYLEKIQTPTLASLYGAMLAGVSCVLMGAGIPRAIPGILDRLAQHLPVELRLDVAGGETDESVMRFCPEEFWPGPKPRLRRPEFYAIVSSATLATVLAKKASGRVDGFIVEGPTAGGHNAPPRGGGGAMQLTSEGEPVYGERDAADLDAIGALGLPYWVAGSCATPERLAEAVRRGAAGVQVGTAFAYCEESGLDEQIKRRVLEMSQRGEAKVFTDPRASPTGFPFKVLRMEGTMAAADVPPRERICDLGYLRQAYRKEDGSMGWRCPAEPVEDYLKKGGREEETVGRVCVCNGLVATIGMGQVRDGREELPLVTSGDDVATVARFLRPGAESYTAADVIEQLLEGLSHPRACVVSGAGAVKGEMTTM
jgi:nitronate monooxygenase